jgi:hypothetical protein
MEQKTNEVKEQKNVNDMTKEEQIEHYKTLFAKSKKLIKIYEDEKLKMTNSINTLKEKLKEYETGIY